MFALVALSVRNESFLDRHKKVFLCSVCCCCCWRHFSPATTLLKANKTNFNKSTHRAWLSKGAESNSTPLYLPPPLLPNPFVVQPVLVVALQTLHTVCAFLCGNMGQRKGATSVSNDTIRVRPRGAVGDANRGVRVITTGCHRGVYVMQQMARKYRRGARQRCLPAVQCTPS